MRHNAGVRLSSSGFTVEVKPEGLLAYKQINFKEEFKHCAKFAFYLAGVDLSKEQTEEIDTIAEGYYTCSLVMLFPKEGVVDIRREDKTFKGD